MTLQTRIPFAINTSSLSTQEESSDRFTYHVRFVPLEMESRNGNPVMTAVTRMIQARMKTFASASLATVPPTIKGVKDNTFLESQVTPVLVPEIGTLFLDRTRIRPNGFSIGEHLTSLSLGPNEEVTLEQKSYSERQRSFEDATETEDTRETEFSSSLSTDLANALQQSSNDSRSDSTSLSASASASYYGASVSVSASSTSSVSSADATSRNDSAKNTKTKSEKIAGKYRAQHKTTMKISETDKFESSSKRVIRNPNQFTPIDLIYFKILQRLKLSHERYGVRYCWAPFVKSPGAATDKTIQSQRTLIESRTPEVFVGAMPTPPPLPGSGTPSTTEVAIGSTKLDHWGIWGDMRYDFEFTIKAPSNYKWDGDIEFVKRNVSYLKIGQWGSRGNPDVYVVSAVPDGDGTKLFIHAGVQEGGPGADLYVDAKARFISTASLNDPAYQEKYNAWVQSYSDWMAELTQKNQERQLAIDTEMNAWTLSFWRTFNPVSAAMNLLVSRIDPALRDEATEVEFWNKLFDFDNSQIQLYPGWWSDEPLRDPSSGPSSFANASWARIFLPIKLGFEETALRWLLTKGTTPSLPSSPDEKLIAKLVGDITAFRTTNFGGEMEGGFATPTAGGCPAVTSPSICMGTWDELLPTDGTHLEVLQAKTSAVDDINEKSMQDAQLMMATRIASQQIEATLTDSVASKVTASTSITPEVSINIGSSPSGQS